jgi:MerR family transcriptional regulator, heat shock protein HspR
MNENERAIYVISVAAELAGVHPQTLRIYERKGLLRPQRTSGNTRRYSERDIMILRRIQELTGEGLNLAGVVRVMELELELEDSRARLEEATEELRALQDRIDELAETQRAMALVPLRDVRRVRRAMKADALDALARQRMIQAPPVTPQP